MKNLFKLSLAVLTAVLTAANLAAQTSPQYEIKQSVVAGGGASSSGGTSPTFGVTGTIAQPSAGGNSTGTTMTGGNFGLRGGFWQAFIAPTAAMVSVSGRVTTANGNGISNVRVSMTNQAGASATAVSNSFGNFRFDDVAAGEIYVFTVQSRRYQFSVPSQVLSVSDNVTDLIFIADWK
jgi:Carboxypeptidase regulatory-like domain